MFNNENISPAPWCLDDMVVDKQMFLVIDEKSAEYVNDQTRPELADQRPR